MSGGPGRKKVSDLTGGWVGVDMVCLWDPTGAGAGAGAHLFHLLFKNGMKKIQECLKGKEGKGVVVFMVSF